MRDIIITILLFGGFRIAENWINKRVEKAKVTANTWDDFIFIDVLKPFLNGISGLLKKRK
jgi:hypothetical protein